MNNNKTGFIFHEEINWEDLGNGIKRKILAFNKDLMMVFVKFEKGAIGYLHKHIHSQSTYVVKGAFKVKIENDEKILKQGDVFFVEPNIEHGVVALEEENELLDIFSPYREDFLK